MKRVVIAGPGGAGKSTLAARLGDITGLPVIELDKIFWQHAPGRGPAPTQGDRWAAIQRDLVKQKEWIMDGDLGPYDVIAVRLRMADTVIFLDFSPVRCAWRAIRRSRESAGFWRWLWAYRRRYRPQVRRAIAAHAPNARLHVLPNPRAVRRFVARVACDAADHARHGRPSPRPSG
jgi:adenylate kinase family enzyme